MKQANPGSIGRGTVDVRVRGSVVSVEAGPTMYERERYRRWSTQPSVAGFHHGEMSLAKAIVESDLCTPELRSELIRFYGHPKFPGEIVLGWDYADRVRSGA